MTLLILRLKFFNVSGDTSSMRGGISYHKIITRVRVFLLILLFVIPFQNCGTEQTTTNSLFYPNGSTGATNSLNCLSPNVDCGPQSSFLQVSIDIANPLVVNNAATNLAVSGRCNDGGYPEHYLSWTLTDSLGNTISQKNESQICIKGKYSFNLSLASVVVGVSYSLSVEIIGLLNGAAVHNYESGGSAQTDFSRSAN